jgi:hypothetical protein
MLNTSRLEVIEEMDQTLLNDYLWPLIIDSLLSHDSYLCFLFPEGTHRPWPTKRLASDDFSQGMVNNFVGANGGSISLESHKMCPEECRPRDHKDWLLC